MSRKQELLDYLKSLETQEKRDEFASACETTFGNLQQIAYGFGHVSPTLAKRIQTASTSEVAGVEVIGVGAWTLRPDVFDKPAEAA